MCALWTGDISTVPSDNIRGCVQMPHGAEYSSIPLPPIRARTSSRDLEIIEIGDSWVFRVTDWVRM